MVNLNLIQKSEYDVKIELESFLNHIRIRDYNMKKDYSFSINNLIKGYKHFTERNRLLLEGLEEITKNEKIKSIADFCCGSGKGTLKLAEKFSQTDIYGFDVIPEMIKKAEKKNKENPKVHFCLADVYNFRHDNNFEVVTFHYSCGPLSDKIIQYGTIKKTPFIIGRFCCYHTIPDKTPNSKNYATKLFLKVSSTINGFTKKLIKNYINPQTEVDLDLLSNFAKIDLKVTEEELKKIASISVDTKIGSKIIDLNRVMKLIERGYVVKYDEGNHIVVAKRILIN